MLQITRRFVAQLLESSEVEDEFEDDDEDAGSDVVIDIDQLKLQCLSMVNVAQVIERMEAIPQLIGFSSQASDTIDELQEAAFGIITTLMQCESTQVKQGLAPFAVQLVRAIEGYITLTAEFKCDRPSAENACACLQSVVSNYPEGRKYAFDNMLYMITVYGGYMRNSGVSMAKYHCVATLSSILQASSPATCLTCADEEIMSSVTAFLVETCKTSGSDLVLASKVLDTFYEIYAESNYNKCLADHHVIPLMQQGLAAFQALFKSH